MGLDFLPGEAHWSYGGFNRFRGKLAQAEGIVLDDMADYHGDVCWNTTDSVLKPLLNHSDCDGVLTPQQCASIAPRLRQIIATWPQDDWDYDTRMGSLLAQDMERCAISGENLEFR